MGASASVSRIPLRPEFDLDTVQDIVGDAEWKDSYLDQFQAASGDGDTVSYDAFAAIYQRNLLAQTSSEGLCDMLLRKFAKVLSGEGSEEALAKVQVERERRRREALDVRWQCTVCSVDDQQGGSKQDLSWSFISYAQAH